MKIVLAGSPQISVPAFEQVIKNFDVVAIVTQPDRPKGRGMKMIETPVAQLASKYNIKIFKPNKPSEIIDELKALNFDLFLTFAFGQFLPNSILEMGKYKPMNIHGSLLPKYRGAAPIHYAILNGDEEIGITFMEMIKEMDAGDMYFKASQPINKETTTGDGFKIVSKLARDNIVNWIREIEKGNVNPEKQSNEFTYSPKIKKDFAELKNNLTKSEAFRKIKGLNPFPGAFIFLEQKRLKVFNASETNTNQSIELKFKDGSLFATEFQWEGKKIKKVN